MECAVDANPLVTKTTIKWTRVGDPDYPMETKTKTTEGVANVASDSNVGVVMLTVLNATASDSGAFACVADNGVGQAVKNYTYLLVRREFIKRCILLTLTPTDCPHNRQAFD